MPVELRRLTSEDREAAADFAIVGLRPERVPLLMNRSRVLSVIDGIMSSEQHFHLAAFEDGRIVAGIAVMVTPMLFFERCEAHIVMFFSRKPGAGFRLLREAMRWVRGQPLIRRVLWSLEDDADHERIARIAERHGFKRRHALLAAYKGE